MVEVSSKYFFLVTKPTYLPYFIFRQKSKHGWMVLRWVQVGLTHIEVPCKYRVCWLCAQLVCCAGRFQYVRTLTRGVVNLKPEVVCFGRLLSVFPSTENRFFQSVFRLQKKNETENLDQLVFLIPFPPRP